jgi:hypothetical protein
MSFNYLCLFFPRVVHALGYSVILNILVSFLKFFLHSVVLGCKNRSQCISCQVTVHVLLYETPKIEFIENQGSYTGTQKLFSFL